MESSKSSTTITTETIQKICVQLGLYRNPICNEKLYLHHKGFDNIDEDAFDPYTDVKVLWLESNALSFIACGKNSRPRRKTHMREPEDEGEPPLKPSASHGCSKSAHLDCCADWTTGASPQRPIISLDERNADADATNATTATGGVVVVDGEYAAPSDDVVGEEAGTSTDRTTTAVQDRKDVFQSLYPTLRQLFLHNNALREMPDLSGFQRLDTVNLSSNCFYSVQAHCDVFNERVGRYEEALRAKLQALLANSKSMQREFQVSFMEQQESPDGTKHLQREQDPALAYVAAEPMDSSLTAEVVRIGGNGDMGDAGSSHVKKLEFWRHRICSYAEFCPHEPLEPVENGKLSDDVPPERRNPCSSIRTLNLSGNYLTSVRDVVQLLCYKNLASLDLSHNRLDDGEVLLLVLERLPRLRSLKLSGNPLVRTLPRYRKTVLARCVGLVHLDDRPVFAAERRLVTAWARGGEECEKREWTLMKKEAEDEHVRRLQEFREMVIRTQQFNGDRVPDTTHSRAGIENVAGAEMDVTTAARRETPQLHQEEYNHIHNSNNNNNNNDDDDDDDNTSSESDVDDNNGDAGHVDAALSGGGRRVPPVASTAQRVLTSNTPVTRRSHQQRDTDDSDSSQCREDASASIYIPSALV